MSQRVIAVTFLAVLGVIVTLVLVSQLFIETGVGVPDPVASASPKERYELAKLVAEISQIRSDTLGSLFWLKLIALLVTVGGGVGGYLAGQAATTQRRLESEERINKERLEFDRKQKVDAAFDAIVHELGDQSSTLIRASAAVKLGQLLKAFPTEWHVSKAREGELVDLAKKTLAAALAIEGDAIVQKTLTIVIRLDLQPKNGKAYGALQGIDLSNANANDAYWKDVDFTGADFYRASLRNASFRGAILEYAQFREAVCSRAVFKGAVCKGTNFEGADLRGADFSTAILTDVNVDGARVCGAILPALGDGMLKGRTVDLSSAGDGSQMVPLDDWRRAQSGSS
jgi:hypothetical protein